MYKELNTKQMESARKEDKYFCLLEETIFFEKQEGSTAKFLDRQL